MFTLHSPRPGLVFAFFFPSFSKQRLAEWKRLPMRSMSYISPRQTKQVHPSGLGCTGLWCFRSPPKPASLHRHEAREARSSASQLPRTRAADSASCPARTPKRRHSVRRTAHMLARPVQRRERFERSSGRRALHGPDRWRQWRCAAITSGSGERMDRAKPS